MSYSLGIVNGDLDLNTNTLGIVAGLAKLTQDLGLWIREKYQIDRFHPDYGSVAESHIGNVIDALTIHELEVETIRVLTAYQQIQMIAVQANPGKFTLDELLESVDNIDITPSYDRVYIAVTFTTASGIPGFVAGEVSV